MICPECKARFSSNYKECPSCGNKQINQEQRIPLHYQEIEPVSVLVEFTELDDFGTN